MEENKQVENERKTESLLGVIKCYKKCKFITDCIFIMILIDVARVKREL